MSLRFQLNVRILFLFVCILILGGSIAIWRAREAVSEEVGSSVNLAVQLVKLGFSKPASTALTSSNWSYWLSVLRETRHLNIRLQQPTGEIIQVTRSNRKEDRQDLPPTWFIALVAGHHAETRYPILLSDGTALTLIIQPNPMDETVEVWKETVAFFISLCLLVMLTFLAVHQTLNKTLKFIDTIVEGLRLIETGQYRHPLPAFSIREYDSIARAINHLAGVLDTTREENHALTRHSLQIQEEERRRLSQELHDELGQSLTAIKVMAVTAAHEKADTRKITESITAICDHLMTIIRSMMHQLHPLILTELGLKATLEDLVNHWAERHPNLTLTIDCPDEIDAVSQEVAIQIFRVIQECLTNTVRHAQAKHVKITLSIDPGESNLLYLNVSDDGLGCDVGRISSGFGLRGIRERIKSMDGELAIDAKPGEGMMVSAIIPVL
ncbi:MAG: histidine kinase [Methylomicrobium sp.]